MKILGGKRVHSTRKVLCARRQGYYWDGENRRRARAASALGRICGACFFICAVPAHLSAGKSMFNILPAPK